MDIKYVVQAEKEIKKAYGTSYLSIAQAAKYLGIEEENVRELISKKELKSESTGSILAINIAKVELGYEDERANEARPIDYSGKQRYPSTHSIKLENLTQEQWEIMNRNGTKELKPYWNADRKKWCLALSLGYNEEHKRNRKVILANTQEELWAKYGEYKAEDVVLAADQINPKENVLFNDYFATYLKSLDGQNSSRTYTNMKIQAQHIIKALGNYKMYDINSNVLRKFINNLTKITYVKGKETNPKSYYSQSAINKIYDLLHCAIKNAVEEDLLQKDYMNNIKKPKARKRSGEEYKVFTDEELIMLTQIASENAMIKVWIYLLIYTGVRPSEALALKFSDIDYQAKTIKVLRTLSIEEYCDPADKGKTKRKRPVIADLKNEHTTKKQHIRTLTVGDVLLKILKDWDASVKRNRKLMQLKKENGTEELLFCGSRGQLWFYEDYKQVYERLLKKHKLSISDYNPYRFRHTFCTKLFRMNVNLKSAQLIMGDNTPDMVMKVYANLDRTDVLIGSKQCAVSLDKVLSQIESDTANSGKQVTSD